jgi:hypothetical protein
MNEKLNKVNSDTMLRLEIFEEIIEDCK